ncbi:MAG: hypothetical protein ACLGHP_04070 [Vicinamibacteria bacterium]
MSTLIRGLVAVFLLVPQGSEAQARPARRRSIHGLLGVLAPTGRQRAALGDAFAIGVQGALGLRPAVALVGGVLVAQTGYKRPLQGDVTIVQYDAGVEFAPAARPQPGHAARRGVTTFIGGGGGVRVYALRDSDAPVRQTSGVGYVSLGGELAIRRAGLRLELRNYLSRSEYSGARAGTRNDIVAVTGLAYHFR